ncbi:zinc ribbon domain-containing protein [Halomonas sp. FL8]|uniref:zinc ribbon domain-containing protein n=1 Tax=unclassified Halomonas TaxID=2609666 RepID=UPI0034606D32
MRLSPAAAKRQSSQGQAESRVRTCQERRPASGFIHKLTKQLIHENQVVAAESLQLENLLKNRSLAKAISNVGWHQFTEIPAYKAQWYRHSFVQLDRLYLSSKRCHACGHSSDIMPLSVVNGTAQPAVPVTTGT